MNLIELYQQIPAVAHSDIKVIDNNVYVRRKSGAFSQYQVAIDGELVLVSAGADIEDVAAKLEALIVAVSAIYKKLGL